MNRISFFTIPFTLLITLSCSSISKDDCKKDMYQFGIDHGHKGAINLAEDIRKICISAGSSVDLESYIKGFNDGWNVYCSPIHGLENGMKGDLYKSFCPQSKEEKFHNSFLIGKKIYEQKDQVKELEDKIREMEQEDKAELSAKDELIRLKENVIFLNREIQRLEQLGKK